MKGPPDKFPPHKREEKGEQHPARGEGAAQPIRTSGMVNPRCQIVKCIPADAYHSAGARLGAIFVNGIRKYHESSYHTHNAGHKHRPQNAFAAHAYSFCKK